jgi:hypothetical protein
MVGVTDLSASGLIRPGCVYGRAGMTPGTGGALCNTRGHIVLGPVLPHPAQTDTALSGYDIYQRLGLVVGIDQECLVRLERPYRYYRYIRSTPKWLILWLS